MAQLNVEKTFQIAMGHHQAGRIPQADKLYRQILAQQPKHAGALQYLGMIAHQLDRNDIAVDLIRQAIAVKPTAEAYYNLGIVLSQTGQPEEAVAVYRQAISLKPNNPDAFINLGNALMETGQVDQAIAANRQAIALKPNSPEGHNNLGNALRDHGQLEEAITAFAQAIALRPTYAEAHANLGIALGHTGQMQEAIAAAQQAIALKPNFPEAYWSLGIALRYTGQMDDAIAAARAAISLKPTPEAYYGLGIALAGKAQLDQAIAAYRQAIALRPSYSQAHSNLIFTMLYDPDCDARSIAQEAARWNDQHAQSLKQFIQPHANDPDPQRRLRVGYVSPDLRGHSVAYFLENLLAHHDAASVEVFCYSDVVRPDATTARLRKLVPQWRNIVGSKDAQVDKRVREDGIDILVDLTGHTSDNRLLLFARKPAPIQVSYLGYPYTTGLTAIDYRLTDAHADPPGMGDDSYSEQLVRLPQTFLCYRPPDAAPVVGLVPAHSAGYVTFGSFNSLTKINGPLVAMWSKILHQVPNSRLILKTLGLGSAGTRQHILQYFAAHHLGPDRVEMIDRTGTVAEHLQLYNRIDIALDTYPYHGTTTTCEALWMGMPVITLAGHAHVSRVGVTLLSNVGVPDLIADSPDGYVRLASALANDIARLDQFRSTLRQRMERSPLMDAPGFARNVEAAYRQMWRAWCER